MAALTLLLFLGAGCAWSDYPEIKELSRRDALFKQVQQDIERFYRADSRPTTKGGTKPEYPPLQIFRYRNRDKLDLFSLAARLNLTYDTLATLNGLNSPEDLRNREQILIPNQPGIFVPFVSETGFQEVLKSMRASSSKAFERIVIGEARDSYLFYPGDTLHPLERAYFLNILFRFPLPFGRLTSRFGVRASPFTGHQHFHYGIDLAAPVGTEVYAAREGIVESTGFDRVLGNNIVIRHQGGFSTVYGHLSAIMVGLKQSVTSGMIIGKVGNTGMATGSHLHFEIRRKGFAQNPEPLLPMKEKKD